MRTPGSAEELERVRMIAVNMFELVKPPAEIAACLGVHQQTVRDWRRVWQAKGRDGLRRKPHPGRPCELSPGQKQQLVELLAKSPAEHGFDRHVWTTPMIAQLIQRHFGVSYHHDWVGELLHALGFSWQKPQRRARERDEQKVQAWRQDLWPELLKKTPQPTA